MVDIIEPSGEDEKNEFDFFTKYLKKIGSDVSLIPVHDYSLLIEFKEGRLAEFLKLKEDRFSNTDAKTWKDTFTKRWVESEELWVKQQLAEERDKESEDNLIMYGEYLSKFKGVYKKTGKPKLEDKELHQLITIEFKAVYNKKRVEFKEKFKDVDGVDLSFLAVAMVEAGILSGYSNKRQLFGALKKEFDAKCVEKSFTNKFKKESVKEPLVPSLITDVISFFSN
jgi:hypothetical protein